MNYLGAVLIVVLFVGLLKLLKLIDNSKHATIIARTALVDIRNPLLSDEIKEKNVQRYALQLFKYFFILTITALLALAIPVGVIWLLDYIKVLSFNRVIEITLSVWFLIFSTLIISGFFWLITKRKN